MANSSLHYIYSPISDPRYLLNRVKKWIDWGCNPFNKI